MPKFDVIVGNPPYQSPRNVEKNVYVSLWPKFWSLSFRLVSPGGRILLVTPRTWCGPGGQLGGDDKVHGHRRLWDVFNEYTSVARVHGINRYFPGVGSSFSVVHVDTSGTDGLSFHNEDFDVSLGFYPLSGVDVVRAQLSSTNNIGSTYRMAQKLTDSLRVSIPKTRKITEESVEVIRAGGIPTYDINPSLCTFIYPDTVEQAEHVRKRVLECADVLYKHCRYNGFIEHEALKMVAL